MCCQESGEREAVVQLFCPKAKSGDPKIRSVSSVYCRVWMNKRRWSRSMVAPIVVCRKTAMAGQIITPPCHTEVVTHPLRANIKRIFSFEVNGSLSGKLMSRGSYSTSK